MTGWFLHGLARGDAASLRAALGDDPGATGCPAVEDLGSLLVIHAPAPEGDIPANRRRLLGHARILERAMTVADVLPMRFGHVVRDPAALRRLLISATDAITAEFDRLSGHVEYGVRLGVPREAALAGVMRATPGLDRRAAAARRAGLSGRIEFGRHVAELLDRQRAAAQRRIVEALARHARDIVRGTPESDVELLRAEFLLHRSGESAFVVAVEAAAAAEGERLACEPVLRLIGPAPAFHFTRLALLAPDLGKAA